MISKNESFFLWNLPKKRILEDNINDNAKRIKDYVAPFPDGSAKSEMMTIIENTRKDLEKIR